MRGDAWGIQGVLAVGQLGVFPAFKEAIEVLHSLLTEAHAQYGPASISGTNGWTAKWRMPDGYS